MTAVAMGFASLIGALILHLVVWRIRPPKAAYRALLIIFTSTFLAVVTVWSVWVSDLGVIDVVFAGLIAGSCGFCYVLTYIGIEYDSPTLSIVLFLAEAGATGASEPEFEEFIESRPFVRFRLARLVRDGLVRRHGNRLELTAQSSLMLALLEAYRRLMQRHTAGG